MSNRSAPLAAVILLFTLAAILVFTLATRPALPRASESQPPTPLPAVYDPARQSRTEPEGRALTYGTPHFLMHYTDEGEGAIPRTDENQNGVPDYVERIGRGMETAWEAEINRIGFAPPPPDGGLGGDNRFDIYLFPISYFGYSDSAGGFIGDNPLTPAAREQRAAFSYMALDNTFQAYTQFGVSVEDALDITSAHEFNHSVQYGYDGNEELWLLESTAAVVESLLYPRVHDNIGYLVAHADQPDKCLPLSRPGELDYHPYSHWYFLKYLVENHPLGERILPRIWDKARDLDGLFALNAGLNGELDRYWGDWVVANLSRQDCPAGAPYCMADAGLYPSVAIEGRLSPLDWDDDTTYVPPSGVGSYGVDYIDLTPFTAARIPLDLAFVGRTPGVRFTARLVGFADSAKPEIAEVPLSGDPLAGAIRFDATRYRRLYLTVENRSPVLEANCGRAQGDYTVLVERPGVRAFYDASLLSAPALVRPGERFDLALNLRSLLADEPAAVVRVTAPDGVTLAGLTALDAHTVEWRGALGAAAATATLAAQLNDTAKPGDTFEITAVITGLNAPEAFTLTTTVRVPQPILLVDDAGGNSESEDLRAALDTLGRGYDVWRTFDHGSPTAAALNFYPLVIWNTGKAGVETLIADDRAALAGYLAAGGGLILFGTDLAYDQSLAGTDDSRAFIDQTLAVAFDSETYQNDEGATLLEDGAGSTYELELTADDIENVTLPDVIAPEAGRSRARLTYPDGRAAAVQSLDGRVTLAAFDLSQLGPDQGARAALLRWLLGQ